ncbi:MAG: hypothetical protein ACOC27_02125 [Halanaerobium sp.]
MKKKLLLLIVVLVTAVLLVSGCSTDSLKERMPGAKANINMLLADNDEGDLEYEVGEIKGEEDFDDEEEDSFGTQIIEDIEDEIKNISENKIIQKTEGENTDEFPDISESETLNDDTTISMTTDQAKSLESINFSTGELVINVSTSETTSTLESLTINGKEATVNGNEARLPLNNGPDLTESSLDISYEIEIDDVDNFDQISFDLSFSSDVEIESLEFDLNEFSVESSDYDLTMTETLVEDYEKEEFIDALTVSDSDLFVNFEIAEGINLDLSSVYVKPVDSNNANTTDSEEYKFSLAKEPLTINDNSAELDLDKIVSMLQDPETSDVLIDGDIGLTSDGIIKITKESKLGVKNAVLESAELTIDNYQIEPEAAEEGLTASEVDDIKKALESIELTVDGLTNPLPAAVELKLYVKDGADSKEELYKAENLLTTFNLKAETENTSETVILEKDQFDKFTGSNLFIGVELYSDTTFIPEEYSAKIIEAAQITAKFNVDISVDDIDE